MTKLERLIHYSRKGAPIGVMRFSGLYLLRPESVPDHIASCTTLAIMMEKDLSKLGISIDIKDLIYRIAIHDIPEAITSDVVRPLKYHHPELTKEFRVAEDEMAKNFGYPDYIIKDSKSAKSSESIEGYLMEVIDCLQVLIKLYEEYKLLSNQLVEQEYFNVLELYKKVFQKSRDLYGDILYRYLESIYFSILNA